MHHENGSVNSLQSPVKPTGLSVWYSKTGFEGSITSSAKHATTTWRTSRQAYFFLCKPTHPQWRGTLTHMDAPPSNSLHLCPIIQCRCPLRGSISCRTHLPAAVPLLSVTDLLLLWSWSCHNGWGETRHRARVTLTALHPTVSPLYVIKDISWPAIL